MSPGDAGPPADPRPTVIRLGQFLKVAGLVSSGGEAKVLIADGRVAVNGDVELRRRRQLKNGDVVSVGDERAEVDFPAEQTPPGAALPDGDAMDD